MKTLLATFFALLVCVGLKAQYNTDWGFMAGIATHLGDVGGQDVSKRVQMSRANPAIGIFYRYKMSNSFSVKGSFMYGQISGADSLSEQPDKIARNLSFKNNLFELAGTFEYHFVNIKDFGGTGRYNTFFNMYLFAGAGVVYHDPMAQTSSGEWVKLRPLQTEGVEYGNIAFSFPLGIGSHITFDRKWRLGLELGVRPTTTDFLDDVHDTYLSDDALGEDPLRDEMSNRSLQEYIDDNEDYFGRNYRMGDGGIRGGPKSDDWYFFGTANVSWLIKGKSNFYRSRYNYSKSRKRRKRRSRAKF